MDYIIKNMIELLGKRTRLCRVCTAPHLICYERNYINDQRVTQGVQHLSRKRLGYQMEDLRQKAKTVCLNSATKQAAGLMQEALVATSWERIIEKLSNYWLNKWKQVAGKAATITMASLFLNQARGIANNCNKLSDVLDGLRYDNEKIWWTQYHKAEDEMLDGLISLLDNAKFNDMVSDYMTKDWTDFYIGSTALETQQTGEVPEAVIKEIETIGKMSGKSIRLPFVAMVKALAQNVERTDDIYDFVDYLDEHPWKMRDTLHEVAMTIAFPKP